MCGEIGYCTSVYVEEIGYCTSIGGDSGFLQLFGGDWVLWRGLGSVPVFGGDWVLYQCVEEIWFLKLPRLGSVQVWEENKVLY